MEPGVFGAGERSVDFIEYLPTLRISTQDFKMLHRCDNIWQRFLPVVQEGVEARLQIWRQILRIVCVCVGLHVYIMNNVLKYLTIHRV
jgi:hypothetical protein